MPQVLIDRSMVIFSVFVGVEEREFLVLEGKKRNKFEPGFVVVPIVLIIFLGIYSRVKKANNLVESKLRLIYYEFIFRNLCFLLCNRES